MLKHPFFPLETEYAKKYSFMTIALEQAQKAQKEGEVPIGAVIVYKKQIIACAGNRTRKNHDVTAHAEILAIRQACSFLQQERLSDCDLYVTLEPCAMCAAAISFARIRRLYYALSDPKGGAVENGSNFFNQKTCHHHPEIYPSLAEQKAKDLLVQFFKHKRKINK